MFKHLSKKLLRFPSLFLFIPVQLSFSLQYLLLTWLNREQHGDTWNIKYYFG